MAAAVPGGERIFIEQNVVWLDTDDLDRLTGSYRDVLGLPQVLDQGACRVSRVSPAGFLDVCDKPGRAVHSLLFKDPEGYWLEMQEFNEPRWPCPPGRGPGPG